MRRVVFIGLSLLSYAFLVGMGNLGDPLSVEVPEPAADYAVTVVDQSDHSARLEKFSIGGKTLISGKLGNADVSVPFDKVRSIALLLKDETLTAEVHLKDDNVLLVDVRPGTVCYGKFRYGDFRIAVDDIRLITIHGRVTPKN